MNLEFDQPKPSRYSSYQIDTNAEKFVGLKRCYSTFEDLKNKQFTEEEEENLQYVTEIVEEQIKKRKDTDGQYPVTCPVCMINFNDKYNRPKVLKCGHTFCLTCTIKFISSQKCPTCRKQIGLQKANEIPTNFILLQEIDKFNSKHQGNFVIHCEEHPDYEITFYDKSRGHLLCQKCINFLKITIFPQQLGNFITSQELYLQLHLYWKQLAKKTLWSKNVVMYNKCKVQNFYVSAKNAAIQKIENKASKIIDQINKIKQMRIAKVQSECRKYQEDYQKLKFEDGKREKQSLKTIMKMQLPERHLLDGNNIEQYADFAIEIGLSLKKNILKESYYYGDYIGKSEKIDEIADKEFELKEIQSQCPS